MGKGSKGQAEFNSVFGVCFPKLCPFQAAHGIKWGKMINKTVCVLGTQSTISNMPFDWSKNAFLSHGSRGE